MGFAELNSLQSRLNILQGNLSSYERQLRDLEKRRDKIQEIIRGKRFVKGVLPFSNELRHKQYHIFIMLFDHNQSGTDCGLYFGNDIFPLNKGINRRCVFRQYLP